ncbi:MAG TPA: HEAT repeat domain-containing protein [Jiangellales bacterium]|nr:HEAT repeat domain-containing protein [Jiangellales bacterium]
MTGRFERAMRLMRRHDAQAQEDGFQLLLPHATEHVEELLAEFTAGGNDHGLRCWLLELIGHARSPAALPVLVEHLNGDDPALRSWAARGLKKLDNRPARLELWKARTNGLID